MQDGGIAEAHPSGRVHSTGLASLVSGDSVPESDDYAFASDSRRAGKKRGKQPLWLSTVMRYHIQPVVKRLGIHKRVSWHTFRRTYATLLHANGEDVKVVQELLRHSSSRVTMDVYAQAQTPAKRAAQQKVVEMVRRAPPLLEPEKMA